MSGSRNNSYKRSSSSCGWRSSSRDRKVWKREKSGGHKESSSRSSWSNTGSKSCWNSRCSNSKRVSN